MNVDIERIVREEVRKILLEKMQLEVSVGGSTKNKPQLHANLSSDGVIDSAQKATKTSVLLSIPVGNTYTFVCPRKVNVKLFRERMGAVVQYVKKQYGNRYSTHRVENGLEITRVA